MSLTAGARLGPFEIVSPLGAGGMGEVYRARDLRLDRTVAIKILSDHVATDPASRTRFEREARAIAALEHPHICPLYDVGEHDGTPYLVMPLLDGETLDKRLVRAKGPLPLDVVLTIGTQVADALNRAHRAGITHRDLKPANVMLTKSGAKLLDFGLAKLREPVLANSVTSTTRALGPDTAAGTLVGTFYYMAPEQLQGDTADRRSDIWALGVLLYELTVGSRPFEGDNPASVIGAILKDVPPPLLTRQPLLPAALEHLVEECLQKNPDERWQDAGDVKRELTWIANRAHSATASVQASPGSRRARLWTTAAIAIATATAALAGGVLIGRRGLAAPAAPVVFDVLPPDGVDLSPAPVASATQLALSPDGRRLAFVASARKSSSQLWVRALDAREATALPGTAGASFPIWSPDSRSLAFYSGGVLKKVDVSGGVPEALCEAAGARGSAWSSTGQILIAQANGPMLVCAANGSDRRIVSALPTGAVGQNWPSFLPDGRHFMYYQRAVTPDLQGLFVASLDDPKPTRVLAIGGTAVYDSGYLLFVQDGLLMAQAFDPASLTVKGDRIRVAERVGFFPSNLGYASVTATGRGTLAFGPNVPTPTALQWRTRAGKAEPPIAAGLFRSPRLSLDGKRGLVASTEASLGAQADIWSIDVGRGVLSRLTSDPSIDWFPMLWPGTSDMAFGSARLGYTAVFRRTGLGEEAPLLDPNITGGLATYPNDISADGRYLIYTQSTERGYDLGTLMLSSPRQLTPFLSSKFNEAQARFSPDGRWIAYISDESGRFEVYVRPFPRAEGQVKISVNGGTQPEWRGDGAELYFVGSEGKMMAVPLTASAAGLNAGVPQPLFDVEIMEPSAPYPGDYAVTRDGQRFLVNAIVDRTSRPSATVMLRWTETLVR